MAKTIATCTAPGPGDITIRLVYASRRSDCWPGWEGASLDIAGYWAGRDERHEYLGRTKAQARAAIGSRWPELAAAL